VADQVKVYTNENKTRWASSRAACPPGATARRPGCTVRQGGTQPPCPQRFRAFPRTNLELQHWFSLCEPWVSFLRLQGFSLMKRGDLFTPSPKAGLPAGVSIRARVSQRLKEAARVRWFILRLRKPSRWHERPGASRARAPSLRQPCRLWNCSAALPRAGGK